MPGVSSPGRRRCGWVSERGWPNERSAAWTVLYCLDEDGDHREWLQLRRGASRVSRVPEALTLLGHNQWERRPRKGLSAGRPWDMLLLIEQRRRMKVWSRIMGGRTISDEYFGW